jgi:Protein of unknown function (DUF3050)
LNTNDRVQPESHRTASNQYAPFKSGLLMKGGQLFGRVHFEQLRKGVAPLRQALLKHSVYDEVDSIDRLRDFMQIHVFAVWDFMSLVKRLQTEVTFQRLPWMPPVNARIARFANEVVLGEESDLGPDKRPASHFGCISRR